MGYKKVCLECRIALNRDIDLGSELTYPCPECAKPMTLLSHRFRAPKKTDIKAWEIVKFLIENGFPFQHIYKIEDGKITNEYAEFPKNMKEAKEFISIYKEQGCKK